VTDEEYDHITAMAIAILRFAVKAQRQPGEALAAVAMAAARCMLLSRMTVPQARAMFDTALAAVKPSAARAGLLPS
jgi:hypothetical protein